MDSVVASVHRVAVLKTGGESFAEPLATPINLQLNGYTSNLKNVNITPYPSTAGSSYLFDKFNLTVDTVTFTSSGSSYGSDGSPAVNDFFNANVRVMPGRNHIIPIFLDDAMLSEDNTGSFPVLAFDRDRFIARNFDPDTNTMNSMVSDYVRFDISNIPARPQLSTGGLASRIYLSGDNVAISAGGNSGTFNVLLPAKVNDGQFDPPVDIAGTTTPGTYVMVQDDPSQFESVSKIASLQGIWRDYTEVTKNLGSFETIVFPNSFDSNQMDMALISRNANGVITNFYYGEADFDTNTFVAFPLDQIVNGGTAGEITGTLTNLKDGDGIATTDKKKIRIGTLNIAGTVPANFQATGRFFLLRL